ncbi:two-component system, sensor histidine kinase RegB [Tranquillimonas rosea]|uniref:histidine kinase n=1 Tax=Tranquillimonas rosea TaxID=641238 RepID=A0A1H9UF02_9RHOB|nr:ActS/PrrB/RegB family redox-sensitive histidine kinase [Tranquillimonas rosea]SES07633.1 two-component system, sensor histidine kinase RegB [Tranquillimonas rosea]
MSDPTLAMMGRGRRADWVRLRSMVQLRWAAIAGQLGAILATQHMYNLSFDIGLVYLVIGALAISNVVASFIYPENKRLSEIELFSILMFDVVQLAILLALTGGLNNPFALLILAPVTISATTLQLRGTLVMGVVAIVAVTMLGLWHIPLHTPAGHTMQIPRDFVFGIWAAIVIGIVFQAIYARRITAEINAMSDALMATQMALAREQKLTDLGGVVAAAAHELGTPLATIKLVSSELMEELSADEHRADAALIRDQADRCRDILRSMGRAGKDDPHLRSGPFSSVVQEAAEPHQDRGKDILWDIAPMEGSAADQPVILRRPEIIHGLRNLIQNAVDFAESRVWIDIVWDERRVLLRITDDGPGFPSQMLPRLGDPLVRRRWLTDPQSRPGYDGMGLGLFIAKTLLERSGAEVSFANGVDPTEGDPAPARRSGAIIEVSWRRGSLGEPQPDRARTLGDPPPVTS